MNVSNPYDGERRPGTVGLPLPGVELRLSAADDEIQLRGPNVFTGYWRNDDATAASFVDGWFRTGDVGRVDGDGYISIVGRTKELIITGGYNVYPREVEEALLRHPSVREAAVIGTPDPEWGEVVTAFVVADTPIEPDELRSCCAESLAPYKQPRLFRFVDTLPRNAMGKIDRRRLAEGA
jgi:malonyl-CoA/methylmalonyl-CoA synthetase